MDRRKKHAFSLVELLVAVTVFSIGIVPVVRSLLTMADALDRAQSRLLAADLLQQRVDRLQEEFMSDAAARPAAAREACVLGVRPAELAIDWESVPAPEQLPARPPEWELLRLTLTLSWSVGGRTEQRRVTTSVLRALPPEADRPV